MPKPGTPEGDRLFRLIIKTFSEIAAETGYRGLPEDSFWIPARVRQVKAWAYVWDKV